jgi:hypothetical protein
MGKSMKCVLAAVLLLLLAALTVPGALAQEVELQQWRAFDFTLSDIPSIRYDEPWEPPVTQRPLRWASFDRQEDIQFPKPFRPVSKTEPTLDFAPFTPF